jgi:hypothetical protein
MVQQHEDNDHLVVKRFFGLKDLIAERIAETDSKTPDFKIKQGAKVVAFCEVKSPQNIFAERATDAIAAGKGGVIERGYGNDYRQGRCIARAAAKAAEQFKAANPDHDVPNILILVNHDEYTVVEDFEQTMTGYAPEGGDHLVGEPLQNAIPDIDLYIWIDQKSRNDEPEARLIYNHKAALKPTVQRLLKP